MLRWVQSGNQGKYSLKFRISSVTGLAEPVYGTEAIHPVTDGLEGKKVFSTLQRDDLEWLCPEHTNVETQTFYFNDMETGYMGFAQIIHSNMVGLYTTAQQTFKIFHKDTPEDYVWTSTKLENFKVEGTNFYADGLKLELIADGDEYHFQSDVCKQTSFDLIFKRCVDGVKFGADATTYYGKDKAEPWGTMRHVFWPRNNVTGTITLDTEGELTEETEEQAEDSKTQKTPKESGVHHINGKSMFVMALQGMKPHHAAKAWNFLHFVSKDHSVVIMEFTTPKSYGTTQVSVAVVSDDEKIITCSIKNEVKHMSSETDEVGWPVPKKLQCHLEGYRNDPDIVDRLAKNDASIPIVKATVNGDLNKLSERVDVMAEIPTIVKNIVSGVVGTKPYIYQFCNPMTLTINGAGADDVSDEQGVGYSEASFISPD